MKLTLLRYVLLIDAAVLCLLGALLIFAPRQIEAAFGFRDLPVLGVVGTLYAMNDDIVRLYGL